MKLITRSITYILGVFLIIYFTTPVLSFSFVEFPSYLLLICIVLLIRYCVINECFNELWVSVNTKVEHKEYKGKTKKTDSKIKRPRFAYFDFLRVMTLLLSLWVLGLKFYSSALFHAKAYRNLIGDVKIKSSFEDDFAPVSTVQIRVVDRDMAYRLGDKVLGTIPSLGSQVDIGEFTIQMVRGKLYWIAPVCHSGFFKWKRNKNGTPGYIKVSATDPRDVSFIEKYADHPIRIKYQKEAYFQDCLDRHIYFNGYMTNGFTDATFEINEFGKPFWIVTLYDNKVVASGGDATGVLVIDVETGRMNEYAIDDAPRWIDRIQPKAFILDQLDDWGRFIHGFGNWSNQGMLQTTKGLSLVYGNDGKSYWYSGLTSVGADEGTVGFVLVNTRTKETIWYQQVGATEQAARKSAMGKVQEKGYEASFPITYNINGVPTYVMSLKDKGGLSKMTAMVSVRDYTIVGVGNNLKETLRNYKNTLHQLDGTISPTQSENQVQIKGTIVRLGRDIRGGNTSYYMQLREFPKVIFIGSSIISNELPISNVGDTVKIVIDDFSDPFIDIVSFDNKSITQRLKVNKKMFRKDR
ncbi:hypothetical protein K5X82_05845 [Halosquirtibacter xylanolyticus]|uniref:hypothetical protein n=1 Tax=Halosquirtibacter xylanolyticus TaxID=3374599 RepID=UPI00374874ED|nr:hypothetical protein K5X82_05845 [Prolixibacteraceae bacterium]